MTETLKIITDEITGVLEQIRKSEITGLINELSGERRVFVDGEGRSGFSARGFAMRLMHLGYTVFFVGETITPAVQKGDLFIAVSGSGNSMNVVQDAKRAKSRGAFVAAVTGKKDSPLAGIAEKVLIIPGTVRGDSGTERGSQQLLSSLFDQSLHIVLDAVCLMLSRRDHTANETATAAHW